MFEPWTLKEYRRLSGGEYVAVFTNDYPIVKQYSDGSVSYEYDTVMDYTSLLLRKKNLTECGADTSVTDYALNNWPNGR